MAVAVAVLVVAAAMGWMTRVALELDARTASAARLAQDEEAIGLAIMGGVIHGLRLNFLEWYRWCFEGDGLEYKPFQRISEQ